MKSKKNNTFLTESELSDLKKLKAEYVNDTELSEFIKWLDKYGLKITLDNRENKQAVWSIVYDAFMKHIMRKPGYEAITNRITESRNGGLVSGIILQTIDKLPPEFSKFWEYALKLNLSLLNGLIRDHVRFALDNQGTIGFDFDCFKFITEPDFDLSVYSVKGLNSDLKANSLAIASAYNKFFETVFKPLNDEQKAIVKDNFIESMDLCLKASTLDDTNFRKFTNYIFHQSQKA